ncbi:MAG: DUF1698 domain-containing protein, partial [Planctomycetaceae bacterium]|nr:DUF1698 domain-containing protein [Planctomycetaceae bacterium]
MTSGGRDSEVRLFDYEPLFQRLKLRGQGEWAEQLRRECEAALHPERHGTLEQWIDAWKALPAISGCHVDATGPAVTVTGECVEDASTLRSTLMRFHPWRKGPFALPGVAIDTEWRSDLKWHRLAEALDFRDRFVLDVGCGNGYYGWKMLQAGAETVMGLDPFLLYVMQFEAIRRYSSERDRQRHFVLPLSDAALPERLNAFEITLSMGGLYHRTSPIDHLLGLASTL